MTKASEKHSPATPQPGFERPSQGGKTGRKALAGAPRTGSQCTEPFDSSKKYPMGLSVDGYIGK